MGLIASLIQLNKNKEAIEKIKEIIKINPKDADIYSLYATSLIRIGDLLNAGAYSSSAGHNRIAMAILNRKGINEF